MNIPFTKMVGAGNDFLIVDTRHHPLSSLKTRWPQLAKAMCDRRSGVGADGLLVLEPSKAVDVKMRVFNPDGSEADMCGNGARCVALYQVTSDRRQVTSEKSISIETRAGVLSARVRGERVAMRMTDPTELSLGLSVPLAGRRVRLGFINTGVPHAVVPVAAVERVDVVRDGRALRAHRRFAPRGTNVDFIQPAPGRNRLQVRTYERGVEGETPACGTGAAASAIIHTLSRAGYNGRPSRHRMEIQARSGDRLAVSFRVAPGSAGPRVTDVVLEGRARRVFDGAVEWPKERRRWR